MQGRLTIASADGVVRASEPLSVTLSVNNPTPYPVALRYDSGMTADLWLVSRQGQRLWAWSNDMRFTQALRNSRLEAGKTLTVKFVVPSKALMAILATHATGSTNTKDASHTGVTGAKLEARLLAINLANNTVAMAPVVLPLTVQP
ncbi:MAG: BsuPI-related putative proteinase inhibitor [Shewanella sp.]